MRRWDLLRCVFTIGLAAAVLVGCGRTQLPIGAPGAMPPTLATGSARTAHISTLRGWMSPDRKKTKRLLYVSEVFTPRGVVDVFSRPRYSLIGQITDGIDWPSGLAIDAKGNLYVSNFMGGQVTVYPPGETSPSLTLNVPDSPAGVAVGSNGYVYVAEAYAGGIDVYPPGATSPSRRLANQSLGSAQGVAVTASSDVYVAGNAFYYSGPPLVVKFANATGSGKVLGLTGLVGELAGVIVDDHYLIVSDYGGPGVLIYPFGQKSPSSTISVAYPSGIAITKAEHKIYVAQTQGQVGVYEYPSGTFVTNIPTKAPAVGPALYPAPTR
jgi:hypothetical protein